MCLHHSTTTMGDRLWSHGSNDANWCNQSNRIISSVVCLQWNVCGMKPKNKQMDSGHNVLQHMNVNA